ncbi:MFS transporter [Pseudomonas sp. PA15(2017)]|uniref:efflux RND transporter permease subunit n=1 Tax=Pseudomonas sp. PA15(2017) TaxID=1932111 RepID=UPI00095BD932|nr:efflux RND transporter permease subunit [Pseudomonas sp. PA15(2017)]OLU23556.1 MFS transporter [Pseudomonas sp. PA15(2017)]
MDIARYAMTRRVNIGLLLMVCFFGGLYAYFELPRLEDPEFTIKEAVITVSYSGATVEQVDQEVIDPLETVIQELEQVKTIRSKATPGNAEIRIEILEHYRGSELPQIWNQVRNKVGDAAGSLPPGASAPLVNDDFGDVYGIYYALTGDGLTPAELRDVGKKLRREMALVEDVNKVELMGVHEQTVVVEVDPDRLVSLSLSPEEIITALQNADQVVSGGGVQVAGNFLRIRPTGAFDELEAMRNLPVGEGRQRLRLGDVARVYRDYSERPGQLIRFNGEPAVTLGFSGQSGANIVEVGKRVEARLGELMRDLPTGLQLHPIYAQHKVVDEAVGGFVIDVAISILIVVAVLCVAMGLRGGLIIGSVLLLTALSTLLVMLVLGIELERISLGALVIAMGMLVDNALVICDGVLVRQKRGLSFAKAASEAVKSTQWPLLGSTFIGILAFAGIGLSQDTTGEFLFSLFAVVASSLLLSWFLAIVGVPFLGYYLLGGRKEEGQTQQADDDGERDQQAGDKAFQGKGYDLFRSFVSAVLHRRRLSVALLVVVTASSLYAFRFVPQDFFPPSDTPLFTVDVFLPQGTDIRESERVAGGVESWLAEQDGVSGVATFVGTGASRFMLTYMAERPEPSLIHFVVLVDDAEQIAGLAEKANKELPDRYPEGSIAAKQLMFGPNEEAKLEARFSGPSPEVLRAISAEAQRRLLADGDVFNVRDNWRGLEWSLRPQLNLERLADSGLTRQAVAQALALYSEGYRASAFREADERIPILLRAKHSERVSPEGLLERQIWSPSAGRYIPLSQVSDGVERVREPGQLHRYDRELTVSVRAEPRSDEISSEAQKRIAPLLEGIELPHGYSMKWGGDHESSSDAQEALAGTLGLPYLAMIVITVLLFSRVRQPLIIWLVVPMSVCGVVVGLLISGLPFGFMALLGLLSLTGMLIKNAVILVNEIDQQIADGVPRMKALVEASASRLSPVSLAAITTALGVAPLLLDPFFANMAVTIIGGLVFATLLTLVAVPCLYALMMRINEDET